MLQPCKVTYKPSHFSPFMLEIATVHHAKYCS